MDRLEPDLDARPSHLGQAAWHYRIGPDRPGRGAARPGIRAENPLSRSPPGLDANRRAITRHLLGEPRSDASPHGHHLHQLSAYAGDLSFAFGAPTQADPLRGLYRQYRARRGDR